ncbi:MAG TPA: hypothetical protein VK852_08990, partial [Desulfobacterales bacterium]|nr:hypothetical protein [Desulfobacterales bacterium]
RLTPVEAPGGPGIPIRDSAPKDAAAAERHDRPPITPLSGIGGTLSRDKATTETLPAGHGRGARVNWAIS